MQALTTMGALNGARRLSRSGNRAEMANLPLPCIGLPEEVSAWPRPNYATPLPPVPGVDPFSRREAAPSGIINSRLRQACKLREATCIKKRVIPVYFSMLLSCGFPSRSMLASARFYVTTQLKLRAWPAGRRLTGRSSATSTREPACACLRAPAPLAGGRTPAPGPRSGTCEEGGSATGTKRMWEVAV